MTSKIEKLFSYGTLQQEAVQRETFSRKLEGSKDSLIGHRLDHVRITDPGVIALSGKNFHKILIPTGNDQDEVDGTVFDITPEELLKADAYEVKDYKRVQVKLRSGLSAWAYVKADIGKTA